MAHRSHLAARTIGLAVTAVLLASRCATAQTRDMDGRALTPFAPGQLANVLIFVTSDCPVSNGYAPEIQRLCGAYGKKGISCTLVYEDLNIDEARVRRHLEEYRYRGVPAVIDRDRSIATRAGATITPQTVVVSAAGQVEYRGRIDNRYEELAKPRRVITSRDLRDALDAVLAGRPVPRPETPAVGCYIEPPAVTRKSP